MATAEPAVTGEEEDTLVQLQRMVAEQRDENKALRQSHDRKRDRGAKFLVDLATCRREMRRWNAQAEGLSEPSAEERILRLTVEELKKERNAAIEGERERRAEGQVRVYKGLLASRPDPVTVNVHERERKRLADENAPSRAWSAGKGHLLWEFGTIRGGSWRRGRKSWRK